MVVVILSIDSATSTIYLHVKQTEGNETASVSFDLGAATMEYGNNAPYYHWGRKDPMPPSTGLNNNNKLIYGTYSSVTNINTDDLATMIRNPHCYNKSAGKISYELWNVGNTSRNINVNPVIKSVYDPSPAGFHLPCSGAFQGWNESGRSYIQTTPEGLTGRYFYQLGVNLGDAIFFPSLGNRNGAENILYNHQKGEYWSVGPGGTNGNAYFLYSFTSVSTSERSYTENMSCRPVKEE